MTKINKLIVSNAHHLQSLIHLINKSLIGKKIVICTKNKLFEIVKYRKYVLWTGNYYKTNEVGKT